MSEVNDHTRRRSGGVVVLAASFLGAGLVAGMTILSMAAGFFVMVFSTGDCRAAASLATLGTCE